MRTIVKMFISVVAIAAFADLTPGPAVAQAWTSDEARLQRGDVIISFKEAPDTHIHEVQGEIVYDADREMVWSVLTDYTAYAKIFPYIAASEVLSRKGNHVRVHIHINNLWPYPDFDYVLAFKENKQNLTVSWQMEEGNLKTLYGSCVLETFAPDPNKTKAVYVLARDPGWFVPKFSADLDNRSGVIERLLAIRKKLRDRKKQLDNETKDDDIKPKWKKALFWWEKEEDETLDGNTVENPKPPEPPKDSPDKDKNPK